MLDFRKLKTPPEDGDVLVEPPCERLEGIIAENRRHLDELGVRILGMTLRELRRAARQGMGVEPDRPVIMTGHQPEFIHAGVWAKHVVASSLARAVGGAAVNLVVDSDAPTRLALDVPVTTADGLQWRPVRFADLRRGAAHESIDAQSGEQLHALADAIRDLMGDRFERSCLPTYFAAARDAVGAVDWVDQMVRGRSAVERALDVELRERRVSRVWPGPLLAHLLLDAAAFAQAYNAALADYRARYRVRGAHQPIPDLEHDGSRVEAPVWVYRKGEARRRLWVYDLGEAIALCADEERIAQLDRAALQSWEPAAAALQATGYAFRPRALSLTLWARLVACDLFIHGIGGAKYDRITDDIIRRYFGVEPPQTACVSATMFIDAPTCEPVTAERVRQAKRRLRDVRYNPQRHVPHDTRTATLIDERQRAVRASVRLRRDEPAHRAARRRVFNEIRSLNDRLLRACPDVFANAERDYEATRQRFERQQAGRNRAFFFALLEKRRLEMLRDTLAATCAFRV